MEAFLTDRSAGTQLQMPDDLCLPIYNNKIFRLSCLVVMALQFSLKHHLLSACFR